MKHQLVPLIDVGQYSDRIHTMNMSSLPPHVPVEDIQIDVTRTEKALKWGGIHSLGIGAYEGDGTEYEPTGFQDNGNGTISATAARVVTRAPDAVPTSRSLSRDEARNWRSSAVYFNSTAIQEDAEVRPVPVVRDLDQSLRRAIANDVVAHEFAPKRFLTEIGGSVGVFAASVALNRGLPDGIVDAASTQFGGRLVQPILTMGASMIRNHYGTEPELPFKHSFMYGVKFDRVGMAGRHLARPILSLPPEAR